jgi:hypothetical protein
MWHKWGRGKLRRGFQSGNLKEKDHLEDLSVGERKILKGIVKRFDGCGPDLTGCAYGKGVVCCL